MKVAIYVLIISTFDTFINLATCEDESLLTDPIITKSYPRKLKKLHILNPVKFDRVWASENQKKYLKKNVMKNEAYTIFPPIAKYEPVSQSPFFQPEHDIEPRIRVKKVLPDYLFTLSRGKRSVNKDDKEENIDLTTRRKGKNKRRDEKKDIKHDDAKVKGQKNNRYSTMKIKKIKVKSNNNETKSTPRLRYTEKRKRKLRNGRIGQKGQHKAKTQERHANVGAHKNLRNKKLSRQVKKDARRLIAAKEAMISDYPYVVSIQKGGEHWCAGALVNERLVITTANCVWKGSSAYFYFLNNKPINSVSDHVVPYPVRKPDPFIPSYLVWLTRSDHLSRLRIRAGTRHADRGGQLAKIQEVLKHPQWSIRRKPDNDVAFILMDRNIKFSDKVHSLDLPNHAMMPAFDDAWVTSWGAERRDGIFENTQFTLQAYHARLMDHQQCNNITQRFGVSVSENFICLTQTGRRAPCTRDTGAPAVSDGILWGLASWGIRKLCGTERFPAMFSYLASQSNMDFITNATQYLMSEKRFYPFPDRFDLKRFRTTTPKVDPDEEYNNN